MFINDLAITLPRISYAAKNYPRKIIVDKKIGILSYSYRISLQEEICLWPRTMQPTILMKAALMNKNCVNLEAKERLLLTLSEEGLINTERLLASSDEANFLDEQLDAFVENCLAWQPIDTAPKDGSWIIVPGGLASWGYGCQAWVSGISGRKIEWDVKHWMPLPKPPISL